MVKFVLGAIVFCGGSLYSLNYFHGFNAMSIVAILSFAIIGASIGTKK